MKTHWKSQKKEKFVLGDTVKGRAEPCHIVYVALFLKLSAFTEVRLDAFTPSD